MLRLNPPFATTGTGRRPARLKLLQNVFHAAPLPLGAVNLRDHGPSVKQETANLQNLDRTASLNCKSANI
jgi:hypothetical protein